MNYGKKYKEIVGQIKKAYLYAQTDSTKAVLEEIFPELAESWGEKVRKVLIKFFSMGAEHNLHTDGIADKDIVAWLEKQESEPNRCHHKVDLSNCSEEYRKAYYDGYNKCNRDWIHSQEEQKASYTTIVETGDGGINALVTRELPTDGCDDEQKPAEWSKEDEAVLDALIRRLKGEDIHVSPHLAAERLKSLKGRVKPQWKPSDEQMELLSEVQSALLGKDCHNRFTGFMWELKKLKEGKV